MPFPFAILAPIAAAVVSGATAVGSAVAAGAAAAGAAAASVGGAVAAGAAAVGTAAAATAAALGTTGMIVAGVGVATAILVVVACITIEIIREKLKERAAKLRREAAKRAVKAKILQCRKTREYNEVNIGLYDDANDQIDEMVIRGEEMDSDVRKGKTFYIAA